MLYFTYVVWGFSAKTCELHQFKIVCSMGILTKSIPLKKRFFRKAKKIEIRPEVSGTGRNGAESILDTSTETFDTFP